MQYRMSRRTTRFNRRRPRGLTSGPTRSAARLQSIVRQLGLFDNSVSCLLVPLHGWAPLEQDLR
jgi:hypothetical protein